jgi:hypothetical protein
MAMHDYLYAIVDRLPRAWRGPLPGIGGAPVEAQTVASFLVLRSRIDLVPVATPKTLAAHHDVVASAMDAEALLPFRFGTAVPSGEIDAWLMTHRALLRATVAKLRGCVEMNVKLLRLELGGIHGSEPLGEADLRRTAQLEMLGERLVARAGIQDWRYRLQGRGSNVAASVAFLVPRGEVPDFLTRIAPIASRAGAVAVVPTGPWPAYSFVPVLGPAAAFDRVSRLEAPGPTAHRRVS